MENTNKIKVWDSATRLYHWLQLLLLVVLWWSAQQQLFGFHQLAAYSLAALLSARLLWAFIGSETSRLGQFLHAPATTWRLLRQGSKPIGHNPLSAYMIVLLWLLLVLQFLSGLSSSDDLAFEGPWYSGVPSWLQSLAGRWHHLGFDLLLIGIGVHVIAALLHEIKGQGVIAAMITGRQRHVAPAPLTFVAVWRFWLLVAVFVAGFVWWQGPEVWAAVQADLSML